MGGAARRYHPALRTVSTPQRGARPRHDARRAGLSGRRRLCRLTRPTPTRRVRQDCASIAPNSPTSYAVSSRLRQGGAMLRIVLPVLAAMMAATGANAQAPQGYPADYATIVENAK